ncbi:MAG: Rieske 2Fe-2S domain-containing protein [Ktedonobacteraceae bacterium]
MTINVLPRDQKSWVETPPLNPPIRNIVSELVENQSWLDTVATPVQNWLAKVFGKQGDPQYVAKDMLNGTWLGHPLHPVLVSVPLGAWSVTALCDLVALSTEDPGMEGAADLTLAVGLAGALGAAVTGITQWSDLDSTDRRVGLFHGLLNGGITVLYTASAILRRTGQRRSAVALSTTGYLASLFSAYLGGELVYGKGIGVNHVAFEGGSDDFVVVMKAQDLAEGKLTRVDAAGIPAVLLRQGKSIYAIAATCSHLGGPLDEGTVNDGVVQCPWHGSCFRMSDGTIVHGPATYAQPTFAVRVRDGNIELRRLEHA